MKRKEEIREISKRKRKGEKGKFKLKRNKKIREIRKRREQGIGEKNDDEQNIEREEKEEKLKRFGKYDV